MTTSKKAKVYYNEKDPFCVRWLRNLIAADLIAPGEVDDRDIQDVKPSDLKGFDQHHFFAGIGGWSYALRLAGWPDTTAVWTGSCPCQPFSTAGKGKGFADERHLWPSWLWLITQCRPATIIGEQVAGKDGIEWWDLVSTDLEAISYQVGAADLCAASVGAPHKRQRLFWLGYTDSTRPRRWSLSGSERQSRLSPWSPSDFVWCRDQKRRPVEPGTFPLAHGVPERVGRLRGYGNSIVPQAAAAFIECCAEILW